MYVRAAPASVAFLEGGAKHACMCGVAAAGSLAGFGASQPGAGGDGGGGGRSEAGGGGAIFGHKLAPLAYGEELSKVQQRL